VKRNPKVRAIGETGLDFYRNYSNRKNQEEVFRKQITLARELGLPLVVHMRDAEEETLRILREEGAYEVGGVMHCFSGSYEAMRKAVDLGFYISYSGIITYGNAGNLREVVRKTPTTRILLETDAPFLTPQPVRGRQNRPSYIWHTAKVLTELLPNTSLEDVERMTSENAKLVFNIGNNGRKETVTYVINLKRIAAWVKSRGGRVRVDTNGLLLDLPQGVQTHPARCLREGHRVHKRSSKGGFRSGGFRGRLSGRGHGKNKEAGGGTGRPVEAQALRGGGVSCHVGSVRI